MTEFVNKPGEDGRFTVVVSGEVDIDTVEQFLAAARAGLDSAGRVELDLGGVTFIDSSGLGALVRIRNEATERGRTVELTHVPAKVTRILELTGLTDAFPDTDPD